MLLHSYPRNGRINESRVHDQPIHEQPRNRKLSDIYPYCHSVSYHPPFVYFPSFNPSALTITAFRRKKRYLDRGKDGKTRKKGKKELLRLGQRDLIISASVRNSTWEASLIFNTTNSMEAVHPNDNILLLPPSSKLTTYVAHFRGIIYKYEFVPVT